jgi:hypothetical protein
MLLLVPIISNHRFQVDLDYVQRTPKGVGAKAATVEAVRARTATTFMVQSFVR